MSLSKILKIICRIKPARSAGSSSAAGSGTPTSTMVALVVEHQSQTHWCWAAVSASVARFFSTGTGWTQCKVANQIWSRQDCCGGAATSACNNDSYLDLALRAVRCFDRMTNSVASFIEVTNELASGEPVCVRTQWGPQGGGHFLAIRGVKTSISGRELYLIDDPIFGRQQVPRMKFETDYRGSGIWTHTYYVKNGGAGGGAAPPVGQQSDFPDSLGG